MLSRKAYDNGERDYFVFGGMHRYIFELCNGLLKQRVSLECLTQSFRAKPFGSASSVLFYDFGIFFPLLKRLKRKPDEVFHAVFPEQGLFFPLLRNKNSVVTFHHLSDFESADGIYGLIYCLYEWVSYKIVAKYATKIIAVSSLTKDELISRLGVNQDKISVISQGIDDRFKPKDKFDDKDFFIVGSIGGLGKRKGMDFMISTIHSFVKKYPNVKVKFRIYGRGSQQGMIKNTIRSLGLEEKVELEGYAEESALPEIYTSFDVFLFCSTLEGFGFPILESQKSGVPVLLRKALRIPKEVSECGVKCTSVEDMADKLFTLLKDKKLYSQIRQRGIKYSERFTWENCAKETIKVYKELSWKPIQEKAKD